MRVRVFAAALGCLLSFGACGGRGPAEVVDEAEVSTPRARPAVGEGTETASPAAAAPAEPIPQRPIPEALRSCAGCHFQIVKAYLGHGMAASLGAVGAEAGLPAPGSVRNPDSGNRYEIVQRRGEAWLEVTDRHGGVRRQRVAGRIGAGIFDASWVSEEVDPSTGELTGRLFFAPVETLTGRGLELAPFDLHQGSPGVDFALTQDCLTCHTTDRAMDLPGAHAAANRRSVFPPNALGSDAFRELAPIGCDGCHGDTSRHRAIATGTAKPREGEGLGLSRLRELPTGGLRDVCARCHLQGEARIELIDGAPDRGRPLAAQIPVLVPARDLMDFRFVGQTEQLALSPCFQGSPEMTCVTCHDPHTAAASQGIERFEAACATCHDHCSRPPELTVAEVTGAPARGVEGCVDCHLRRDQPMDLPHLVTADHRIRRRLPPRVGEQPHRQFRDPEGPLELYDDGRLAAGLATPAGKRWRDGVLALGLASMGRLPEAAELFAGFPAPGTPEARQPAAPSGWQPLETSPLFHHMRAMVLQAQGELPAALAAYGDALELDPQRAAARFARARLRLDLGDLPGVIEDTEVILNAHPKAEQPWNLRAELATRLRRPDMAARAFESSAAVWPANPFVWYQLAQLRRLLGDPAGADEALARALTLRPDLPPPPSPAVQ